jgi:hypothetical protein
MPPEIDAATPVGLRQSTETWDSRFPAMLVGYMRVSSESAKQRPYNVTRCLLPVSTSDTCSRTRPVARATIVSG